MESQNQNPKKLTPDMAGYRPDKEWWPDLTEYRKAMLLHNISFKEIHELLKEYATLTTTKRKIICDFFYTSLPDNPQWIYLEFPTLESIPHYQSFWNYQDLLIWLSQKSDREFCLAIPKTPNMPLFLSTRDTQNPYGDSCVGVYASRDFYFYIPGNLFEWGPVPTSDFPLVTYLKESFSFDTLWIPKVSQCRWERTEITLSFSE